MAIIYSYPTAIPTLTDLLLGTDVDKSGNPTKNFTIQSVVELIQGSATGLGATLTLSNDARIVNTDGTFGANQSAINFANITGTGNVSGFAGFSTVGGANINGTTGAGFTAFTSTVITGTLQTSAQPNITSLGTLTALVIDGPISGTNLITSTVLAGALDNNVASTLAIKTYVDDQIGLFDTLAEVLANGNTTGGTDVAVSAGDDITFTDTSKAVFGTTDDLQIYSDGSDSYIWHTSPGDLFIQASRLEINGGASSEKFITANQGGGVQLYYDNSALKFETLTGGARVIGAFEATTTGTFIGLLNTGTYTATNGVGTAGQILSSTGTGTSWVTEVPLYNWSLEGTTIPSGTAVTVTDGNNITTTWDAGTFDLTIATTGLPDGSGAANQVTFWSDADTLTGAAGFIFAGGATGQVTVAGILQAGTLSDGTFSGTAGTYTGGVSIESTTFVGALTGNADTATALAAPGTMSIDGDFTTTVAPTYTSGGSETITANIADTVVTAKILTNLPTPTSAAIAASDTILAAMAKLQGQITGIPQGLVYKGTWDASTNTPTLATGVGVTGEFYIVSVAGTTNLDGITDWQIGDWAIFVEVGATDTWQKIDNTSAILGSGTANKVAKWTGSNTLATGLIDDDGTLVTIGNSGSLLVEGSTTLGDATTDTVTATGPVTLNKTLNIVEGIEVNGGAGTAGQVLTSGAGSSAVMSWTTPTTGVVESISGGAGITISGTSAIPVVNVDYLGADNIILSAGTAVTPVGADTIMISDASDSGNVVKALISGLPFDAYSSWTADSDEGTDITVTSGFNLKFTGAVTAGGAGIATDSAVSANEMTIGLINAGGTPGATTFYRGDGQWSVPVGTKTETLAEVLGNGNTTGGTNIAVSAGDDITFTDTSKALFGGAPDLQIYHDGSNSYITDSGTGNLIVASSAFQVKRGTDLLIETTSADNVKLYNNTNLRLETTQTGLTIYGDETVNGSIMAFSTATAPAVPSAAELLLRRDNGPSINNQIGKIQFQAENPASSNNWVAGAQIIATAAATWSGTVKDTKLDFYTSEGNASSNRLTIQANGDARFYKNVEIDDNLTVDGQIIHGGGGSGTIVAKGGTFSDTIVCPLGSTTEAFTISRAANGTMVFDVYFTNDTNGTDSSVAKKFTVVKQYGSAESTISSFKILDTGPGTFSSNTIDFTPEFKVSGTSNIKLKCIITPVAAAQTVTYTIVLGAGSQDATIVLN
jgi:hypothetical protein